MREFVVTLRGGRRLSIMADRCISSGWSVELVVTATRDAPVFSPIPSRDIVAVFDHTEVVAIVATDHLVEDGFELSGRANGLADDRD